MLVGSVCWYVACVGIGTEQQDEQRCSRKAHLNVSYMADGLLCSIEVQDLHCTEMVVRPLTLLPHICVHYLR